MLARSLFFFGGGDSIVETGSGERHKGILEMGISGVYFKHMFTF